MTTQEELDAAQRELSRLTAHAESLRDTHPYADDPAIVSGIRRKPNPRADARRWARNDRQAAAWTAVQAQTERVEMLTRRLAREAANAPVPFTPDELRAARAVRNRYGWHKVVRVNAKSVSVATGYSWVDRIAHCDVLEVRT